MFSFSPVANGMLEIGIDIAWVKGSILLSIKPYYSMLSLKRWLMPLVCLASALTSRAVVPIVTPPTVTISSPTNGAAFNGTTCTGPVNVTLSFSATAAGPLKIKTLTATLDGNPLSFTPTGLGATTASGTAVASFTATGSHT